MSDGLELPVSLRLRPGEIWEARLPGLGSAGYDWQIDLGDPTVAEVVLRGIEADRIAPPGGTPPDSFDVDQQLTLRAIRRGVTTLHLRQLQPWEGGSTLRSHDVSVIVE